MDLSSLIFFFADAANAVAAGSAAPAATEGHSGLSFVAIILWAGLVIFTRHRLRA